MIETQTKVDMNHQNSLSYKIGELINSLKDNGIKSTVSKIMQRIYYQIKGVDFSSQNIFDFTISSKYHDNGVASVSTSRDFLNILLTDLQIIVDREIERDIFLDYGSGKGAAIIHAKMLGFSKTIGIEFAKELDEIAKTNIEKLNMKNVHSKFEDATKYLPPIDVSVIYLFNPFDKVVMEKVAQNILSLRKNFKKDVYIIYSNPSCDVLDKYFKLLGKKKYKSGARADYYKV